MHATLARTVRYYSLIKILIKPTTSLAMGEDLRLVVIDHGRQSPTSRTLITLAYYSLRILLVVVSDNKFILE